MTKEERNTIIYNAMESEMSPSEFKELLKKTESGGTKSMRQYKREIAKATTITEIRNIIFEAAIDMDIPDYFWNDISDYGEKIISELKNNHMEARINNYHKGNEDLVLTALELNSMTLETLYFIFGEMGGVEINDGFIMEV